MWQNLILNKYVLGGVVLVVAITFHVWKVKSLESDLADMTSKYNTLATVTQIQNDEITRWKNLGEQYGKLLDDASKRNEEENKRWSVLYEKIRNSKIPVDCDGAVTHLKQKATEIAKEWDKR
jgi:hypothetical protein